ncbi:MAG: alpha/beta hydrolase family protein, partial [Gemmatimonadaceae bacterium]
ASDSAGRPAASDSARPTPGVAAATPGGTPRPVAADSGARPGARRKDYGSTLVLRELATGAETRIPDVTGYAIDDSGRYVAYAVSSRSRERDGAYVRALAALDRELPLLTGVGNYKQLAFDRAGRQVAFVSDQADWSSARPRYALYHATLAEGRVSPAAAVATSAAVGAGWVVADRGRMEFTRDGSAVVFGVAAPPLDSIPADSLADKAVFDLWHYRDPRLQPQQRVEAPRDRDRAYTAVYRVRERRLARIGNDTFPQVSVSDDGRLAVLTTTLPYAVQSMWGEGGADVFVVDVLTGRRTPVAQRLDFGAVPSPGGKYVMFFKDGQWYSFSVATGRVASLTGVLKGVRFEQETWDTPSAPAPWGVAGWTTDDHSVLVYDRFDVWELDPSGARPAKVVTDSVGQRTRTVFRLVDLDPEDRFVDPAQPLLLRAFDDETKASGFYRDRLGAVSAPQRIVMADKAYGVPRRARRADVYLVTQETFREFPDLWAGERLDALEKISNANPQQSQYRWGSVELVRWRSQDGVALKGMLFKPESFDASKKYPMVVYFYEQLSDELHQYRMQYPRNTIQPTWYVSNDYLVFMPDIAYREGYPGQSAMHSIVPGVNALVERGFVDPNGIGISGQSWGGYQVAYMITQTPMFKAAFAGAPVANMTSAYGGIRWGSGLARAFQYEKTQSRIGGSIWQYPMRFIENSPLFFADRVQTPLLIMHNDNDDAVPWYQGIELFVALRRLGKEVYMLTYNGDYHNPRKRANQKDVALRQMQFFDHHLRGRPAPEWMIEGIPFLQKGRDQLAMPRPPQATPATTTSGARQAP